MQTYLHHLLPDLQAATENLPITPEWYEKPYPFPVPKYMLEWEQVPFVPLSGILTSDLQNLADLVNLSGLRNERTSRSEER